MTTGTAKEAAAHPIRAGRLRNRGVRKPTHPYSVEQEAFQIQPHFIAPVLAGETLISLSDQSRSVSDPILNKLKGWWLEKSYFYVAQSKIPGAGTVRDMHLDFDKDMSSLHTAADAKFYHEADTIDWVERCLESVVSSWYREDDETWNVPAIDGVPLARLSRRNFLNSFMLEATYEALDVAMPDTGQEAREAMEALDEWEFTKKVEGEEWTYEDYLRDQGIQVPQSAKRGAGGLFTPERLLTQIEWTFPTNTVDSSDGSVVSAVIWSPKVKIADKFFNEPGFILGVTVVRPKTYLIGQTATATALLDNAASWLPAILEDNPESTVRKVGATSSPYSGNSAASVVDIKDLFLHGEQFVNHTIAAADNGINIPEADGDRDYAVVADLDALYVSGAANLVRTDGRVSMRVRSHVTETSAPS